MKGNDFVKFKKFQSLTKHSGQCQVIQITESDLQFLNNGYAVYPAHNLPELNDEMIFALFDIDEKNRDNFAITRVSNTFLNYDDTDDTEEPAVNAGFAIKFNNLDYIVRPVFTKQGLFYYDPKWVAPFDGNYDALFVRYSPESHNPSHPSRNPYIAVKSGLFVVGFVLLRDLNADLKALANNSREDLQTLCSMLEVD